MFSKSSATTAYIAPFGLLVLLIGVSSALPSVLGERDPLILAWGKYGFFSVQTFLCGALLCAFWPRYDLKRPRRLCFTLAIGILVLLIWIAPQIFFGAMPRRDGFDPTVFGPGNPAFLPVLAVRFVRLVVVVPLAEEIFWRGFLLRWMIREDFQSVPFGAFSRMSFAVVTVGFMLEHQTVDWPAAAAAGALYNWVAYRTKSLTSCVFAHAATNLLLGLYILQTRQWGFW
jgi:CAAX prenyl protease-like protein